MGWGANFLIPPLLLRGGQGALRRPDFFAVLLFKPMKIIPLKCPVCGTEFGTRGQRGYAENAMKNSLWPGALSYKAPDHFADIHPMVILVGIKGLYLLVKEVLTIYILGIYLPAFKDEACLIKIYAT